MARLLLASIVILAASPGAPAAQKPSDVIDLSRWKLTLPYAKSGSKKAAEVDYRTLVDFTRPDVFFLNRAGDGVVFRAYCTDASTRNSSYPRCELRELVPSVSDPKRMKKAAWGAADGILHKMTITQAITAVPPVKRHVVAGQIHDADDDVLMIRLENTKLFIERNRHGDVMLDRHYKLGTKFTIRLEAFDGHITVWYDGQLKMDWRYRREGCYFKAGCYTQSNPSKGDSPESYAEVVVYGLNVAHIDPRKLKNVKPGGIHEDPLAPFRGEYNEGVDPSTLYGKVICGYQGWFRCGGDGSGMGWTHWGKGKRPPSAATIQVDMWPDVSEFNDDELYDTGFTSPDGKRARLFSSIDRKTTFRHFRWMKEYGIDGVLAYRFLNSARKPLYYRAKNVVLHNIRAAANYYGRSYAVKYDVSSLKAGESQWIVDDWKSLVDKMQITRDPSYQRHNGKPVLCLTWLGMTRPTRNGSLKTGITIEESKKLLKFLKTDSRYGGLTIILGTPAGWRKQERDCVRDPEYLELCKLADIIHPWSVSRYKSVASFKDHVRKYYKPDIAWIRKHGKEFLPVAWPGFSHYNKEKGDDDFDRPGREKGKYLATQYEALKKLGVRMVFTAMFDEVDEGTAVFKCTSTPPPGARFVTYEGLPSDFYLSLVGRAGRLLRGEITAEQLLKPRD